VPRPGTDEPASTLSRDGHANCASPLAAIQRPLLTDVAPKDIV
jgi:hypothetical protein